MWSLATGRPDSISVALVGLDAEETVEHAVAATGLVSAPGTVATFSGLGGAVSRTSTLPIQVFGAEHAARPGMLQCQFARHQHGIQPCHVHQVQRLGQPGSADRGETQCGFMR